MKNLIKNYKLSILCASAILFACTWHFRKIETQDFELPHKDKIVHLIMYIVLSAIICIEQKRQKKTILNKNKLKIFIICTLYGIFIEIIQYFLPYRGFEIADMIADSLGAAIGILLISKTITKS